MNKSDLTGFIILLLFLAGCGGAPSESADETVSAEQAAMGETVYHAYCASCHGENLEGQANWQAYNEDGSFRSPPHDETGHTWHHDDGYLLERIRHGTAVLPLEFQELSSMPAYNDILTDEEITAVLAYIKSRWPAEIRQMQQERTDAVRGDN